MYEILLVALSCDEPQEINVIEPLARHVSDDGIRGLGGYWFWRFIVIAIVLPCNVVQN